ncbi:MAG: tRNA (guanosine(37)-N1)-methyltransferase TrmD [Patescibacteria group bacterium]
MRFDIITIFPNIFNSYFGESILKRAQAKKLINIQTHDLRHFTTDKHRKVDDSPYGGGPGMVLKVEPIYNAVKSIKRQVTRKERTRVILFSTRGRTFDAKTAKRLSKYERLILICGRYEGVDERVAEHIADEEISTGDFVLSGGEIPAMVVVEAVSRFIPGVLGKYESLEDIKGSYPVYTKPEVFYPTTSRKRPRTASPRGEQVTRSRKRWAVPKVLLSGDHKKIEEWRNG